MSFRSSFPGLSPIFALVVAVPASAAIVTVGPGGSASGFDFAQVSDAISFASAGDTIYAKARTVGGTRFTYDAFDLSQAAEGVSFVWGNSPGVIEIGGTMRVGANANLEFELGGTDNSEALTTGRVQYDTVFVHGDFGLEGILGLSLYNGFAPDVGDSFELVATSGTVTWTGSFPLHFTAPTLADGAAWQFTVAAGSNGGQSIFATVVPGPGAIALLGAAGLAASARRRR